jgi:phosphoribosylformylglycinamidine synthase
MRFGVVVFPGTWSDCDFHYVISEVIRQPVKYVWHRDRNLADLDCVVLPGGFSYGDYLRAGAVAGRSPVVEALPEFLARGGLVLGSCNGFQILCEAGLLPGALIRNRNLHFICEHVYVRVATSDTPFTNELQQGAVLRLPIAHADGNYICDDVTFAELKKNDRIIFNYCDKDGNITDASNPNGSLGNIAGICNAGRNVLGLMPHPERACEDLLGSSDGREVFSSLAATLAAVA